MLDQDFELIICVRTCDKKSTLGSVVPLAMFISDCFIVKFYIVLPLLLIGPSQLWELLTFLSQNFSEI